MDSDESVANFDPEFTNSTLAEAGIDVYNDEDFIPQPGRHAYVGPGGSLSRPSGMAQAALAIKPQQRAIPASNGSPLTSSVQENFRGFTYTGESLMVGAP